MAQGEGGGRPRSTEIGLAELRRRSKPGECPFCGDPAVPKVETYTTNPGRFAARKSSYYLTCGSPECKTAYQRLYQRDRRRAQYE